MQNEHDYEPEPSDADCQLVTVTQEGDPEKMLVHLETKARLATRWRQALDTLLISLTHPEDWTKQGVGDQAKACLSSAGAERVATSFAISYRDVKWIKEDFTDTFGKAYRFIFSGYADMNDRSVFAEGRYSTRDKFLGYANSEWKAPEDINENSIRSAAYHVFCGNAIKAMLGLRGMPWSEYERIMAQTGKQPSKSTTVSRGSGTQGGTSGEDAAHQQELTKLCMGFANDGYTVEEDGGGNWSLRPLSDSDSRDDVEIAKDICIQLSAFVGKDKTKVAGKLSKELKGQRLLITLDKARKLKESQPQSQSNDGFPGE